MPVAVKTQLCYVARGVDRMTPVPIPRQWEERVHKDLQRDVALGVIQLGCDSSTCYNNLYCYYNTYYSHYN